jgi:small-conductance mechanosensitive channel
MARLTPSQDFFAKWHAWGLASFATVIGPWQEKLTNIGLVSNFFQPALNIVASIIGPLVCLTSFAALSTCSRARQQKIGIVFFIVFLVLIILCLTLRHGIGLFWFPEGSLQMAVWVAWWIIYLGLFAALGVAIVSSTLATPSVARQKGGDDVNASTGSSGNAEHR